MVSIEKLTDLLIDAEYKLFEARAEASENDTLRAEIEAIRKHVEDVLEKL